ncbi:polyprenyl diphosphate synthase [Candidatus Chazhemtobacterium aquaticus]|uniref:Isoprenyl transferase n=1 Tax=Candidatus Chazhemtobacterium aquaticus TaxID=2715735 RepID=A0A857N9C3_9BACT|nr:polyprenyl diphosphate synthase [Candidatus Chazhemtobacterium aquaticus]QHO63030.1 Undecaprenyl diphosphate synthase [Candidatus Chazhemtobacterium aquaticus]
MKNLNTQQLNHIAIIVDGNRRWAKSRNLPTFKGHKKGFSNTIKIANHIHSRGIHTVTFWLFSTENWNRSQEEVTYLMDLYPSVIENHLKNSLKHKTKIIHLGRKDRLSQKIINCINKAEKNTEKFKDRVTCIALDYGGKDEISRASKLVQTKKQDMNPENIEAHLDTSVLKHPNPDLIYRTSGELRLSGFMTWQSAYAELYFEKKLFPDLTPRDIDKAIREYSTRNRRFGRS